MLESLISHHWVCSVTPCICFLPLAGRFEGGRGPALGWDGSTGEHSLWDLLSLSWSDPNPMLQIPPLSSVCCGSWLGVCSYLVTSGALKKKKVLLCSELHGFSQDINTAPGVINESCGVKLCSSFLARIKHKHFLPRSMVVRMCHRDSLPTHW